ncbi:hypothetical protein SLA2020_299230 [Shorea laevis]
MGHFAFMICYNDWGKNILIDPAFRFLLDPDDKDSFLSTAGAVFGYDPKIKIYKVVRLWDINRYGPVVPPPRVEIYTLGTDSWKEIDCVSPLWSYLQVGAVYIDLTFFYSICLKISASI